MQKAPAAIYEFGRTADAGDQWRDGLLKDISVSAITAGFLAVLISYAGPLVIFFQAARMGHIPPEMMTSWVWAISIGAGVTGLALSWLYKAPVITAWSAPGTALLVTLLPTMDLHYVVGAYLVAGVILLVIGLSGWFDRLMQIIPSGIASGMMAGILFQFGVGAFQSVPKTPLLSLSMIAAYLGLKRLLPRYCLVLLLLLGLMLAVFLEGADLSSVRLLIAKPVFIAPAWSWNATLSLAIPLVLVSLTGQFLPGFAILRHAGYSTPARPILSSLSVASLVVSVFGGITIVVAAITAALCTGENAHHDPAKRYVAGIASGIFYLLGATFAGSIVLLFTALPGAFISVLAGLALITAIGTNIAGVAAHPAEREAAVITFLATASGMSYLGLGSAFWGVVLGGLAFVLLHKTWTRSPSDLAPGLAATK
jgi:benzoate membrane transport protein